MEFSKKRLLIYSLALGIRFVVAPLFVDRLDTYVFFETSKDILIHERSLYFEGSLQHKFNYFPLAYLPILLGTSIYYWFLPESVYLERFMLKLPMMLGDLLLAYLVRKRNATVDERYYDVDTYELFILFNPILIFVSSIKGQFDVFPVIFLFLGVAYFREEKYFISGIFFGISIMMKQYGLILLPYLGLYLFRFERKKCIDFVIGILTSTVPILAIGAYFNFSGMIKHALLFHLERYPSGVSLTSAFFYGIFYGFSIIGLKDVGYILSDAFLVLSTLVFIGFLIYYGLRVWQSDGSFYGLIQIIYYVLIMAFLLNKVVYLQYFYPLAIVAVEYFRVQDINFSTTALSWEIIFMPFIIVYRVAHETPVDTQDLLGSYWIVKLWTVMLLIHIILVLYLHKNNFDIFPNKRYKRFYWFFIILYILNLPFQLFLNAIEVEEVVLKDLPR